jgi:hypothetical protein
MRYNTDNSEILKTIMSPVEIMSLFFDHLGTELDPTLLPEGCGDIWYS